MEEEIKDNQSETEQTETPAEKTYTEEQYMALQNQLNDANQKIQSFADMDIDSIRKSADEWKQKAEQLEAQQKERDYSDKLDKFVQGQNMKNDIYATHLKGLLRDAGLKFDKDGELIGGGDIVKKLKESCPDAFADDKPKPEFVDSTSGNLSKTPDDEYVRKIMGLK